MSEVFITHPVTGEHMDKSQCKRVITQLYEDVKDLGRMMDERDEFMDWAEALADAIADHFGVDIGNYSETNDPWGNALAWIEPIRVSRTEDGFRCEHCNEPLKKWKYCPNCGKRLFWSESVTAKLPAHCGDLSDV